MWSENKKTPEINTKSLFSSVFRMEMRKTEPSKKYVFLFRLPFRCDYMLGMSTTQTVVF